MIALDVIFLCVIASIPLASTCVFLFFWKKLTGLRTGDKLLILGWLLIFTWAFVGAVIAGLTHQTFFLLRGVVAVFGIILFAIASIFWLAYRVFKASMDAENRKTPSKS